MKLTGVNIERFGLRQNLRLAPFDERLTVVIDPQADDSLFRFISGTWFGAAESTDEPWFKTTKPEGWLEVRDQGHAYRLTRTNLSRVQPLRVTPLEATVTSARLRGPVRIDAEIYDNFFCWDADQRPPLSALAALLRRKFAAPRWTESESPAHVPVAAANDARLIELRVERDRLRRELQSAPHYLGEQIGGLSDRLSELEAQIEIVHGKIRAANVRRDLLDQQILDLERTPPPSATARGESLVPAEQVSSWYERLDELDGQWQVWRELQHEIQSRRGAVRDELTRTGGVTIESPDHPYHRARQLLRSLEQRLNEGTALAQQHRPASDETLGAGWWHQLQKDVEALCQELGQQYGHVRQRAGVSELKQLRGCYHEVAERIRRLLVRRRAIIERIHIADPDGAEMVLRGNSQFHALAQQQGYWRARQLLAEPTIPMRPAAESETDRLGRTWQLESSRKQRADMLHEIARSEAELRRLVIERDSLADQNNRRLGSERDRRLQLERIELELREELRLQAGRQAPIASPGMEHGMLAEILQAAGRFLSMISGGLWTGLQCSSSSFALLRGDRSPQEADRLDRRTQDQVAFCLCLAVAQSTCRRGESAPLVAVEPHEIEGLADRAGVLQAMSDVLASGQQIIASVRSAADAAIYAPLRPLVARIAGSAKSAMPSWAEPLHLVDSHTFRQSASTADWAPSKPSPPRQAPPTTIAASADEVLYRFPIDRSAFLGHLPAREASPTLAMPNDADPLTRNDLIDRVGICHVDETALLNRARIRTIGELLDCDPADVAERLSRDLPADRIRFWRACCWLLLGIPELSPSDARMLVECGIESPAQLEEMRGELLVRRLTDHLNATGRSQDLGLYGVERINRWMRSLARTRPEWKRLSRRGGPPALPSSLPPTFASNAPEPGETTESWGDRGYRLPPNRWDPGDKSPSHAAAVRSPQRQAPGENARPASATPLRANQESSEPMRYHLNLNDSVDAAPSIGARVFEQLVQIGVRTVGDFLKRPAAEIAGGMNNRRITAETIREWQQQARIACSIPNLRRHDAQILVACGITDPQMLLSANPRDLFETVARFADSKAGIRLLRSGKKPDLAEVNDWIRWARHTRPLQAA